MRAPRLFVDLLLAAITTIGLAVSGAFAQVAGVDRLYVMDCGHNPPRN